MTNSGTAAERLGKKIRKVRDLRGYSQEYMANKLSISTRTYGRIEAGDGVELGRVEEIANTLGVSVEDLMRFDESIFFENCNQAFIYGANTYNDNGANKITTQYEQRIKQLNEEVTFLREQLRNALK